ncbi:hypothetical protein GsuE55_24180 [Geobacillus subterraneus]|uniref:Uncharacterized protein n=1 Tax=Geobacillus subterraneus TaxID=129338 RepID=A0A679FSI9_9BACL|nr:hypothetical protein B4113_1841 [Geobacillus sp. B4113_201601]BBW97585.1 hypothetical protein GsuE55_24180 [Geobacillus subterraneus]
MGDNGVPRDLSRLRVHWKHPERWHLFFNSGPRTGTVAGDNSVRSPVI